jgi:transposase-like protein
MTEAPNERGLEADHTTIWRWVQRYGPELEERLRRHLKPTNKSWRVDETYLRVKGRWCYLYRAIDSTGATIDFVLSALRDAAAAKRLFRKALTDPSHPQPRVVNTDQARIYDSAIHAVKEEGTLRRRCRHRPVQYLNNILEQDHRTIKRWVKAKQGFREFHATRRTIQVATRPSKLPPVRFPAAPCAASDPQLEKTLTRRKPGGLNVGPRTE